MKRLAAAVVVISGIALISYGAHMRAQHGRTTKSLFGPFAGYLWNGPVHSVSAQLVVPRILVASSSGAAAGWISASAEANSRTLSGPFFQIGVNELRTDQPGRGQSDAYFVFWSSTAIGFHPRFMFTVEPGDAVGVSMTLAGDKWSLFARDKSTGRSKTVSVDSGYAAYEEASWTQEDVGTGDTGAQAPYPQLIPPHFSRLKVNSATPKTHSLIPSWMSAGDDTYGPRMTSAAAFSVGRVSPSAPGLRYEQIAYRLNYPAIAFSRYLETWNQDTSRSQIRAACNQFARVLKQNAESFESYRWPADLRSLVMRLVAATRRSRAVVLALATTPASQLPSRKVAYATSEDEISSVALQMKPRLHIPPNNYSGGAITYYIKTHPR